MPFSFKNAQGNASEVGNLDLENSAGHEREEKVLDAIKEAVQKIVDAIGGHVAVSASGHVNEEEGNPGDSLNIQVNSILKPSDPTPDAGAEAALSSPANYPPEASTAAPQPSDGSPAAPQPGIPQAATLGEQGTVGTANVPGSDPATAAPEVQEHSVPADRAAGGGVPTGAEDQPEGAQGSGQGSHAFAPIPPNPAVTGNPSEDILSGAAGAPSASSVPANEPLNVTPTPEQVQAHQQMSGGLAPETAGSPEQGPQTSVSPQESDKEGSEGQDSE